MTSELIQFIGIEPTQLIQEITEQVKSSLITELSKTIQENQAKRYLSAEEVCKMFGISKPTIHAYKKNHLLKHYKWGSRVYYRLEDIESAMIISD